jgi:hypothetical protein
MSITWQCHNIASPAKTGASLTYHSRKCPRLIWSQWANANLLSGLPLHLLRADCLKLPMSHEFPGIPTLLKTDMSLTFCRDAGIHSPATRVLAA